MPLFLGAQEIEHMNPQPWKGKGGSGDAINNANGGSKGIGAREVSGCQDLGLCVMAVSP